MNGSFKNFKQQIGNIAKNIWFDTLILISIFLLVFFAPEYLFPVVAKEGLFNILLSKLIFISCGIVHAHISRHVLFPYIDFKNEKDWSNNLMIIVLYAVIIWGWARGG